MEQLTQQEIAKHYSACLDSVFVITDALSNPGKYAGDDTAVKRNVDHLIGMRIAPFWTTEDFTEIDAAIAAGSV